MKAIELKRGDACPNCGGALKPARVPTAEEYRRAFDKENPIALPPSVDAASPDQRAELGELFICEHNDYRARFASEKKADQPGGTSPAA
ncbi:MAG: hypothetical protein DMG02_01310 [Acidobacteria bacterium]|nr:MAG: hypothetical protein DMG02_01310 [Acidobacteriota bacterium]